MSDSYSTIKVDKKSSLALITINRPDKLNALNSDVLYELKQALEALSHDEDLIGLILTGSGDKAFIAGADIAEMAGMTEKQAHLFGSLGQEVSFLLENFFRPVVAVVNGFALGGGCEMAISCDLIIATENAVFGQPEVKLGLIPGFGGTQRLAKLIGRHRAKEFIYTGKNLSAVEAQAFGMLNYLVKTKEEGILKAEEIFSKMRKCSPYAVSIAKQVINEGVDLTNKQGLEKELNSFSKIFSSEDMKEGTKAFVEKRAPQFTGK